ncbi:ribosomal RNA-processing protein 14 [Monosporozyma unispora]|nr:hypothetical protein C6P44_005377 [Kazachstania unispora]
MSQSLEDRLRANSNAFDGLLALIPAKYYYDEKTQDQWKAKKKTKTQSKEDKLKKLDPEQQNDETGTALDVLRKREKDAKPVKLPGQIKFNKKPVTVEEEESVEMEEEKIASMEEENVSEEIIERETINVIFDDEGNEIKDSEDSEEEPTKKEEEEVDEAKLQKQKNLELLRSKLQAKIQTMKQKRKAPGSKVDGAPSSREAILSQRKRRQDNKQQRKLNEADNSDSDSDSDSDDDLDDEGHITKKSKKNGGDNDEINTNGIIYQSIMFNDGARATSDLQRLRKSQLGKRKGPSKHDYKGQLKALENRKSKFENKDELDKIKSIEKNKWQKAMLQAEGVKMKDDEKLIKKAIKKKEARKRKSAIEWNERKRDIETNKQEKAKRREENLKIRKENKGVKRSKQQKMKRKFKGVITPKKRAGFEGRLKRK